MDAYLLVACIPQYGVIKLVWEVCSTNHQYSVVFAAPHTIHAYKKLCFDSPGGLVLAATALGQHRVHLITSIQA